MNPKIKKDWKELKSLFRKFIAGHLINWTISVLPECDFKTKFCVFIIGNIEKL